jgi:hypothetical protein
VLFWRITEADRRLWALLRRRREPQPAFDPRWLGLLVTFCALATALNFFLGLTKPALHTAVEIVDALFAAVLCLYFAVLLLRRFQCSLLEWCVVLVVLGNIEGLVLTTPGLLSIGWGWVLCVAGIAAAWVLSGAAHGLASARLLGVTNPFSRLALLAAHWLTGAAPALLIAGYVLAIPEEKRFPGGEWSAALRHLYVPPQMRGVGIVLLVCGAVGVLIRFLLRRKIAARFAK